LPGVCEYVAEAESAVSAVRRACLSAASVPVRGWTKEDASPVTVADFASQAIVVAALRRAFPGDAVIAEETAEGLRKCGAEDDVARFAGTSVSEVYASLEERGPPLSPERRWVLDPIDGTRGFLRGDQYCVALALIVGDAPVVSVIGAPNLSLSDDDDMITTGQKGKRGCLALAVAGQGAFVCCEGDDDWRPLRVSETKKKQEGNEGTPLTLVEGVESSHSDHGWARAAVERIDAQPKVLQLDSQAKAIVLADGRADCFLRLPKRGYVEKIWDVAPAALLVQEAGGIFSDRRGRPIDWSLGGASLSPDVDGLAAANPNLHPEIVRALDATASY